MSTEYLLAIESTCDETAAALIDSHGRVLAECVATQEFLHERFSGVVPEIAARAHLERILPVLDTTLKESGIHPDALSAIAVATFPGLPGSLIVGLSAAKALALAWNKPIVGINHIQAHIYACGLGLSESIYPCVGFIVSGGHTSLYRCQEPLGWDYLGGTIDDAAGEAFDKVAVMLGLPFPGGPALSKLAAKGDRQAIRFPRPLLEDKERLDFSFSGLKTAVRYRIAGPSDPSQRAAGLDEQERANIAAGFEQAVIDCLIAKAMASIKKTGAKRLCVGGGVAANTSFREQLALACQSRNVELIVAKPQWCTDNAAMGALAWEKIRRGQFDPLDLDVQPGLVRPKR
jgi:N6-L-threonylcarbamoyladenine synthase